MVSNSESEIVTTLLFLRYFTAFGLVSLGYDHFLTLGIEFRVIWTNPKANLASKAAFAINRYLTEAVIAYTVYVFSGSYVQLNDTLCGRYLCFFGSAAMIFGAVIHSIVVLRIYALWDQRTNVARVLTATFVTCIVATTTIGVLCELQLQPLFRFSGLFTTCTLSSIPRLVNVMFAIQSFFDVLIIVIAVYNALERPHRTHSEVITSLANDGFKFLLVRVLPDSRYALTVPLQAIFCLRSLYLVSSLVGNPGECFATVATCWSFTSIISGRLHLRLDGLALEEAQVGSEIRIPLPSTETRVMPSSWWDG
ncbi:hypothetical protein B0H19DRAFT_1109507 [Mycena capillaripes]|nr:hypothetical protein B0H19DRAFT_1109507 [Mycena capillaripes]